MAEMMTMTSRNSEEHTINLRNKLESLYCCLSWEVLMEQ